MHSLKMPIYQSQQIKAFETLASERFGISGATLMQRAGKAAFDFLLRRWPQAKKIAVFCGAGNNGGDGYVLARLAHQRGLQVTIWQVGNQDHLKADAKLALIACQDVAAIPISPLNEAIHFQHPDLVIDAVCGMGVHDSLRPDVVQAIEKMQALEVPIFSIDVPSGIDSDTGKILGAAVKAAATMTFIGIKLGLLTGSGMAYTGELVVNDLQLPSDLFSLVEPIAEKTQLALFSHYLKPRLRDWHKGLSGHVLVVGGDQGYAGAPRMAAVAALRVGAGLASVATHALHAGAISASCPEIMCHGIDAHSLDTLQTLIDKASVIVLGPGLGQSAWSKTVWDTVVQSTLPLVVDADGLNLLATHPSARDHWVLTPHPGEAARLLKQTASIIQQNRLAAAKSIQARYQGICVLKGAGTLVYASSGLPSLCDKGNPGMATAGMGDILSGVIAGLIAQGVPLIDAAKLGVSIHAAAGDLAAKEGERGMMATDLMPYLRRICNYTNHV